MCNCYLIPFTRVMLWGTALNFAILCYKVKQFYFYCLINLEKVKIMNDCFTFCG